MEPTLPSTRPRRNVLIAALAMCLVLIVLGLWWSASAENDGPRPSDTHAGQRTLARRKAASAPGPSSTGPARADEADRVEVVTLRLGTWSHPGGKTFIF